MPSLLYSPPDLQSLTSRLQMRSIRSLGPLVPSLLHLPPAAYTLSLLYASMQSRQSSNIAIAGIEFTGMFYSFPAQPSCTRQLYSAGSLLHSS